MNKNQSGFGIVEVILVLVILAIIGFTGWRVYEANREVSQTPVDNSTVKQTDNTQNSRKYTDETYGYAFTYSKSWKTSDAANERNVAPGLPKSNSLTIESTDLATSNEGIGFHLTRGAEMYVTVEKTDLTTPEALLATKTLMNQIATDRHTVTVAGQEALQFTMQYETSPSVTTLLVKNGKGYSIELNYADNSALEKYKPDYESLLKSFKFTD